MRTNELTLGKQPYIAARKTRQIIHEKCRFISYLVGELELCSLAVILCGLKLPPLSFTCLSQIYARPPFMGPSPYLWEDITINQKYIHVGPHFVWMPVVNALVCINAMAYLHAGCAKKFYACVALSCCATLGIYMMPKLHALPVLWRWGTASLLWQAILLRSFPIYIIDPPLKYTIQFEYIGFFSFRIYLARNTIYLSQAAYFCHYV